MTNAITGNWNPETYTRFRGLRLRPALDLIAQIGELPAGGIADLGCGNGAVAAPLRAAFPGRHLTGVDTSAEMLAAAKGYDATILANIAGWQPKEPPALLFSNAALQWLPDHSRLMPQLAALLAPGGVLAVQMPGQSLAPSHRLLRETAMALFPDRFDFSTYRPPVGTAESYWHMLAPLGEISAWETSYMQKLGPAAKWHPVSAFTEFDGNAAIPAKTCHGRGDCLSQCL